MSDDGWNEIADSREDGWCTTGRPASYSRPTHIVIHCTGASYETARTRFTPPREPGTTRASAHYVIKRATGEIVQFVKDLDRSWHAGISTGIAALYRQGPTVWKKYLRYWGWSSSWIRNHYGAEADFEVVDAGGTQVVKRADGADWPQFAALEERFQRRLGAHGVLPYLFADYSENTNDYSIGIELERASGDYSEVQYESLIRLLQNLCRTHGIEYDRYHIIGHEHTNPIERWGWDPSTAFDWERVLGSGGPTVVQGKTGFSVVRTPAGDRTNANPLRAFYLNEAGFGGFYPVGLRRNLHPGVHLYLPPTPLSAADQAQAAAAIAAASGAAITPGTGGPQMGTVTPGASLGGLTGVQPPKEAPRVVRCAAPGYVVAARLSDTSEQIQQLLGNQVGFVLVRHEFEQGEHQEGGDESCAVRYAVYSLYMHLCPPSWGPGSDPYEQVPWLQRLRASEHGSIVTVASSHTPGTLRWLAAPVEGDEVSGTVSVHGAEGPEPFDLGAKPEGSVCAVKRPQPANIARALKGLRDGCVVTFNQPYLTVKAGDPIGFVQPLEIDDWIPSGFVHWEFLAPKDDGLKTLVDLACDKLGLGADFFPIVEDSDGDNHFSGKELDDLLKPKLPQADQDALGEEGLLRGGYESAVVRLWHKKTPFSFADPTEDADKVSWTEATGPEAAPQPVAEGAQEPPPPKVPEDPRCRGELTYPITFEVENFNGLLDPAKHTLGFDVSFEPAGLKTGAVSISEAGEQWSITIQVPAVATKILIEPSADLILDGKVDPTTVAEVQKKAMEAVLKHRWRNVLLRHVSGWSKDGMKAMLAKRFPDPDKIKGFYEPAAWWNLGKQDDENNPRGEVAVLGEAGQEPLLFGEGTDALLPGEGQVDHMHPVTAAWLLNALTEAKALHLVEDFAPYAGEGESQEPLHWGWVVPGGAGAIALGSAVHALVITRGYGTGHGSCDNHELTLKAKSGEREIKLGTYSLVEGVIAQSIGFPLWGKWELAIEGHDGQPQSEIPREVEVLAPAVARTDLPRRNRAGLLEWTLHFDQNRPSNLEGWVLLKVWTVDAGAEPAPDDAGEVLTFGVPVDAVAVPIAAPRRSVTLDESGQFIVGATGPNVDLPDTHSCCDLAEWQAAASGDFKVKISLGRAVDRIREAYGAPVTIRDLAADGLSVHVRCYKGRTVDNHNEENFQKLSDAAAAQLAALDDLIKADPVGGETIRLEVRPPMGVPGPCTLTFDPTEVLNRLLDEKAPAPGKELKVAWGFLAPNGGRGVLADTPAIRDGLDHRGGDEAPAEGAADGDGDGDGEKPELLGVSAVDVDPAQVKSKADDEALEVWADAPTETVTKPQFGPIRSAIVGSWLKLEVDMFAGNMTEWWNAGPHFHFDGNEFGVKTRGKLLTTGQIKLDDPKIKGKQVSITAKCRVDQPTIGGKQVTVAESEPLEFDARPRVEELTCVWDDPQVVVFRGKSGCIPTGFGLELKLTKTVDGAEVDLPCARLASFNPKHGRVANEGVINEDGWLEARVLRHVLRNDLAVGDAFSFSFARPERLDPILGQDLTCEPKQETVPADPEPEEASE